MIDNCEDIILQGSFLHIGHLRQPPDLENHFFVHRWSDKDTSFIRYVGYIADSYTHRSDPPTNCIKYQTQTICY